MRVALLTSENVIANVIRVASDVTNITDFYSENVTNHVVLNSGEIAVIGETSITTIEKPYPSWIWSESEQRFLCPIEKPTTPLTWPNFYSWNESKNEWEVLQDQGT